MGSLKYSLKRSPLAKAAAKIGFYLASSNSLATYVLKRPNGGFKAFN
jgi:hypothetical protein